jgi:hypothetical protein
LVCTPMTAGFTASTISAKLAGPEAVRPKSAAADGSDAECSGTRQPSGKRRVAEAPAAAASAIMQKRTAGRPDGLFVAVGFWSSMRPRCSSERLLRACRRFEREVVPQGPPRSARCSRWTRGAIPR